MHSLKIFVYTIFPHGQFWEVRPDWHHISAIQFTTLPQSPTHRSDKNYDFQYANAMWRQPDHKVTRSLTPYMLCTWKILPGWTQFKAGVTQEQTSGPFLAFSNGQKSFFQATWSHPLGEFTQPGTYFSGHQCATDGRMPLISSTFSTWGEWGRESESESLHVTSCKTWWGTEGREKKRRSGKLHAARVAQQPTQFSPAHEKTRKVSFCLLSFLLRFLLFVNYTGCPSCSSTLVKVILWWVFHHHAQPILPNYHQSRVAK